MAGKLLVTSEAAMYVFMTGYHRKPTICRVQLVSNMSI